MGVEAIFFDVGETLVDETRHWGQWADYLGVPKLTFFAALGGVILRGGHHRDVFRIFDPDFDYRVADEARRLAGERYEFLPSDFYPDAIPCLRVLKEAGYQIGVAGNQPEACEVALRDAGVPADVIASSSGWGVEKPSLQFFQRIVQAAGVAASSIVYVGDRYDNDITPAYQAGLIPIFIRRGPWAFLQGEPANADFKFARIASLADLPNLIPTL